MDSSTIEYITPGKTYTTGHVMFKGQDHYKIAINYAKSLQRAGLCRDFRIIGLTDVTHIAPLYDDTAVEHILDFWNFINEQN